MSGILIAVIAVAVLAAIFGIILGFASVKFKVEADPIVEQIDAILPQTQCGQCGYPGCRPYAEAIANGDVINKCPPGGQVTIEKLADLMGVDVPDSAPDAEKSIKKVAFIHEDMCIGCTKCIQACPVDAIVGGTKSMHTVIKDECTGCDLCVSPCPTDCIEMIPVEETPDNWKWQLNRIPVVNVSATPNTKKVES
ncbi:electron transport complex subunit RsxB [Photobacterium leiognathi]|uniref:Ion-translocating oxidoreductase complex subunit B n=2 Tax=Photobacterium leiognathi TaxID=553611 RepID=A0A2T3MFQ8_PHOLE|nr:electron transport complex subunit RsxB [Photobacterium leiognathi]KJF97879.1 electron transporter RnfB [Photobacterium leiognathi]MCG3886728.1 electron transport complex subunit RsxB [Photobacterium leiognathi]PSU93596.1 electron transport complex subunit RsxB [Photobacterium leiognathi subsp. mandapamensis]PSV12992.1 electron transport complex subunit RsxB [Photobacterium leiognathi subsp. mandapamensis]PSV92797.1 electron transport complex subunit RsxB [Photobacterium leiognathi]